MSGMIERVAQAIFAIEYDAEAYPFDRQPLATKEIVLKQARAAIEVILKGAKLLADPGGDIALHKLEEALK